MTYPTKIYLAARYGRREELLGYRADLEHMGCDVTGRWLHGGHQISDQALADNGNPDVGAEGTISERERFAREDLADLLRAEVVVSFTEPARTGPSRGGRHVEFGIAYATGKRCIVVGHRENVFHCLPSVEFYSDWTQARGAIGLIAAMDAAGVSSL